MSGRASALKRRSRSAAFESSPPDHFRGSGDPRGSEIPTRVVQTTVRCTARLVGDVWAGTLDHPLLVGPHGRGFLMHTKSYWLLSWTASGDVLGTLIGSRDCGSSRSGVRLDVVRFPCRQTRDLEPACQILSCGPTAPVALIQSSGVSRSGCVRFGFREGRRESTV